ncbi:unnamed protein product [Arabis nemorensis]|uniref:Uncharacterized protein n=1 Tax=Arabis nemorensis TaxID=586526 RepID=A0A565BED5_9BRAS|nr:unnamed protein product [Arabis nemorensis]
MSKHFDEETLISLKYTHDQGTRCKRCHQQLKDNTTWWKRTESYITWSKILKVGNSQHKKRCLVDSVDSSKQQKDARKTFQFNQVFGPTATSKAVSMMSSEKHNHYSIRSVMDGSGRSGPPGRSATEMGINYLALSVSF